MDWDRLATQMIREMIRQFLRQPGEFLTFGQLASRIPGSDKDLLHAFAENRTDLFVITGNDQSLKLHLEAVHRILAESVDATIAQPIHVPATETIRDGQIRCGHYSQEELLGDLLRCSLPSEALVRDCCWSEICRIRALSRPSIDPETWRELCATRGYLRSRQNPRGM